MINLLPKTEKQILLIEDKWRLILILGWIILFFFISLILILFSVKTSLSIQVETEKTTLNQEEKAVKTTEFQDFQKEINQTNQTLLKLESFYEQKTDLTKFIEKISALIPKNILINQISISPVSKKEGEFQVSISGKSPLIEDLIELRENLKKETEFSQIYFPPSVWVKLKDIDFNITFQVINQK